MMAMFMFALHCPKKKNTTWIWLSENFVISDFRIFMGWVNGGNITKRKEKSVSVSSQHDIACIGFGVRRY